MIQKLTTSHQKIVLAFAYQKERENMFVIGSFKVYEKPFEDNDFWGYFENGQLLGLATFFKRWGTFVVNAEEQKILLALTDHAVAQGIVIEHIPCFKKYTQLIVERLKVKHQLFPKTLHEHLVFELKKTDFTSEKNHSTGTEIQATPKDIDDLVRFGRKIEGQESSAPLQDAERQRIHPEDHFIVKVKDQIVARANLHGVSDHYFQIGGVGTLEAYRGKGYAKQVLSFLCQHYFERGAETALLFTEKNNQIAQGLYLKLGFKPNGKVWVAEYK